VAPSVESGVGFARALCPRTGQTSNDIANCPLKSGSVTTQPEKARKKRQVTEIAHENFMKWLEHCQESGDEIGKSFATIIEMLYIRAPQRNALSRGSTNCASGELKICLSFFVLFILYRNLPLLTISYFPVVFYLRLFVLAVLLLYIEKLIDVMWTSRKITHRCSTGSSSLLPERYSEQRA
jgi:hypothetical protein